MTIRNLEKPLAASAIALEGAAIALLCGAAPAAVGWRLAALLAHALGATCATAFLVRRAARLQVGEGDRGIRLLFATAAAVLPLVGPAALAGLLAKMARQQALPDPAMARAPLKDLLGVLPAPPAAVAAEVGPGGLEARLRFDPTPARRLAAVLATRRLRTPADVIRLLRLALRDRDEDVRLLAHALLEDHDREAFAHIEELERELAATTAEDRARVACLLAEALYDLCASGLVGGELESFTLRRARDLLEQARGVPAVRASASAALLLARVLLRQGQAPAARVALEESSRLGAPSALLAPHLREAAFQGRDRAVGGAAGV